MQELVALTRSKARAGILAELLGESGGPRTPAELARASGVTSFAIRDELPRLIAAGVIRKREWAGDRVHYEADPDFAGLPELRRFVRVTTGISGRIRTALLGLDHLALAWIYGPAAERDYWPPRIDVFVLSDREKRIGQLTKSGSWPGHPVHLTCVRRRDWIRRLKQKEMEAWRLRRGTKLWIIGSDEALRRMEDHEVSARRNWEAALANWRDEYDWDDGWDPSQHGQDPLPLSYR